MGTRAHFPEAHVSTEISPLEMGEGVVGLARDVCQGDGHHGVNLGEWTIRRRPTATAHRTLTRAAVAH